MARFFKNLARDTRGTAVVETALTLPIVLSLIIGGFGLSNYLYARNMVNHALDEASREAALFPRPNDAAIRQVFNDSLVRDFTQEGGVNFTVNRAASGTIQYADLAATVNFDIQFAFFTIDDVPIESGRRVFLAN